MIARPPSGVFGKGDDAGLSRLDLKDPRLPSGVFGSGRVLALRDSRKRARGRRLTRFEVP